MWSFNESVPRGFFAVTMMSNVPSSSNTPVIQYPVVPSVRGITFTPAGSGVIDSG